MRKSISYKFTEEQEKAYTKYVFGSAYCFPDERIMTKEEFFQVEPKREYKSRFNFIRRGAVVNG